MVKQKRDELTNEQYKDLGMKVLDVLKDNKLAMTLTAVSIMQLARRLSEKPSYQALTTLLQSVTLAGYIGSELEGELQNAAVSAMLVGGGSIAAVQGMSETEGDWWVWRLGTGTSGPKTTQEQADWMNKPLIDILQGK